MLDVGLLLVILERKIVQPHQETGLGVEGASMIFDNLSKS